MNKLHIVVLSTLALLLSSLNTLGKPGDVYIYPAEGQTSEQLERDRYECYLWASREAGFDPAAAEIPPQAEVVRVPVGENPKQGATLAGTIIGAIAGAAIDHRHDRGAVIGAGVGTVVGASIESQGKQQAIKQAEEEADEIAREQQEIANRNASYRRAFSACLEGRGYVVR